MADDVRCYQLPFAAIRCYVMSCAWRRSLLLATISQNQPLMAANRPQGVLQIGAQRLPPNCSYSQRVVVVLVVVVFVVLAVVVVVMVAGW